MGFLRPEQLVSASDKARTAYILNFPIHLADLLLDHAG
jgi:hypothetical protein